MDHEYKPYLSSDQIRELQGSGFEFGAHSIDHPEYRFLPMEEQLRQTGLSLQDLKARFGLKHRFFAFPFTDYGVSKAFFDIAFGEQADEGILDLGFGAAGIKDDIHPRNLQRVPMEGTQLSAHRIVAAEYLYFLLKAPLGKNRIRRN